MKKIFKSFVFLPLILIAAIAFVVFQVKSKPPVEHEVASYPTKAVEVITAKNLPFRARAKAFGYVVPAIVVRLKSEVSGRITYIHPDLKKGASLQKDTVVLRIEPTTYEISLNQSKAGLAGSQSSLAQLEEEQKSNKRSLQIAQENLDIGLVELERVKSLWDKRIVARNQVDIEERKVLQLRSTVEDLQGRLDTYTSRKTATQAQIRQSESQVDISQDTLGRTEVRMPFDARVGTVLVEKDGFTSAGGELFEALGVESVEINAQIPIKQFRPLVSSIKASDTNAPINLQNPDSLQIALSSLQLEARVRLVGDTNYSSIWEGKLIRMSESVDPTRDTLGLVVAIAKPYEGVIPGIRPPLLKGMYTSVEFLTPSRPTLVLPRKAVHQGRVYIATTENILAIRPVNVIFTQGELVIISDDESNKAGINEGDKVIISDVVPVMEGLPLKLIPAVDFEKKLAILALGKLTADESSEERL